MHRGLESVETPIGVHGTDDRVMILLSSLALRDIQAKEG